MRSSSGGSLPLVISLNLTPQFFGWPPELSERKITCLNLEKCSLLLTPPAEIARETYAAMVMLCTICFHLYFILSYKSFERMTLLPVSTQTLPNNIGFSLKRIHTYHSVQFRCARAAYSRLGKDRARPTQMLIASE